MAQEIEVVVDSRGKPRVRTVNTEPSMTVQSDAHMADIQNILAQFGAEDMNTMLDSVDDMFLDVSEFTDLADALNQAREAEVEFLKLPSKVRELYGHKVENWLDTAHDPEKREAMYDVMVEKGFIKGVEKGTKIGEAGGTPRVEGVTAQAGESGEAPE